MPSSQSTGFFSSDPEGFEDSLMALDLSMPATRERNVRPILDKLIPQKRKFSPDNEPQVGVREYDVNEEALATMRMPDDRDNIYGASSFGGYGQYMSRKRAKLQIQNSDMATPKSEIFKGVEIYINGRTEPSVQVLREMIVENGGKFHAYLTKKRLVTHIIAMNLTSAKVKEYQYMKVVRPTWILDCIQAGFLLPWKEYRLEMGNRHDPGQGRRIPRSTLLSTQAMESQSRALMSSTQRTTRFMSPTSSSETKEDLPRPPSDKEFHEVINEPLYMTDPASFEQAARIPGYALNKSNVAAQRLMAQPGWKEENTAASGKKFINTYYENSRLHHLAMWKAELKGLVAKAQERIDNGEEVAQARFDDGFGGLGFRSFGVSMIDAQLVKPVEGPSPNEKGKGRAVDGIDRVYMHCDFDSFFVSVGLLDRPELNGKPVVVCHSQGIGEGAASTSEIASCSYAARELGIRNGMSLGQAKQLCPEVITLSYEFEKYKEASLKFYTILLSFADELQAVSVDEALLDVSRAVANLKSEMMQKDPHVSRDCSKMLAEQIRERLLAVTGCQVSIGIAENILLARIASRRAKPASSYHLRLSDAPKFLAPLPLDMIWGVGHANKRKAEEKLGVTTVGDLTKHPKGVLVRVFGPALGDKLWKAARGLDDTKLQPDQKRKSVSAEINFGIRFEDNIQAEQFIHKLGQELANRLQRLSLKGRHLTIKVMKRHPDAPIEAPKFMGHGICETFSKSTPISEPASARKSGTADEATNDPRVLGDGAWKLLSSLGLDPTELRGIGLQVTKLEGLEPPSPDKQLESGQKKLVFGGELKTRTKPAAGSSGDMWDHFQPTKDAIDMEVLGALPDDIRREILEQFSIQDAGSSAIEEPNEARLKPTKMFPQAQTPNREFGVRVVDSTKSEAKEKLPNPSHLSGLSTSVTRITRQLRPKVKPVVAPLKDLIGSRSLHPMFSKKQKGPEITEQELQVLGLDPEVFFALPESFQAEQLRLERSKQKTPINTRVGVVDACGRFSRSPAPAPANEQKLDATYPDKVALGVTRVAKDGSLERVLLHDIGEVERYLKRWVNSSHASALLPEPEAVEGLKTWLVKNMDQSGSGTGMEKAVILLRYWREQLLKYWEEPVRGTLDDPRVSLSDEVGGIWWDVFIQCKEAVDKVARRRFGGKMSLW